jgi:hypothetical protein
MLTGEVWPHEAAEEAELYLSLNRLLGGAGPTAPMSRAHAEIAYKIAWRRRRRRRTAGRRPGRPAPGMPALAIARESSLFS